MSQLSDLSRSLVPFDQNTTLTVVVELSEASWLLTGLIPGVDRQPVKKQEPEPVALLRLLERWRVEAVRAGRTIGRIPLAFEAGRDGFWLARWLQARDIEVHVVHSTSECHASIAEPRPIGLIRRCSCVCSWDGCAASAGTAGWWRSQRSSKRTPSVRAVNGKAWSASARGSSTG